MTQIEERRAQVAVLREAASVLRSKNPLHPTFVALLLDLAAADLRADNPALVWTEKAGTPEKREKLAAYIRGVADHLRYSNDLGVELPASCLCRAADILEAVA